MNKNTHVGPFFGTDHTNTGLDMIGAEIDSKGVTPIGDKEVPVIAGFEYRTLINEGRRGGPRSRNRLRRAGRTMAVAAGLVGATVGVAKAMGDEHAPAKHHFSNTNYTDQGIQPGFVASLPKSER